MSSNNEKIFVEMCLGFACVCLVYRRVSLCVALAYLRAALGEKLVHGLKEELLYYKKEEYEVDKRYQHVPQIDRNYIK